MKLVIAEKPSVGRSIASVLGAKSKGDGYIEGNGYIVSWALGHLVGLVDPQGKWTLSTLPLIPEEKFEVIDSSRKQQFDTLKKLMERPDVDTLICATDAGREGEAIFRYIYDKAGCRKPYLRLWISSMTDEAITEGFNNLQEGSNFENLYQAALQRNKADSLVGINGTRLFTLLYKQGGLYGTPPLSVGRVQTPTLDMIVERENKINNFKKEKYYKAHIYILQGVDCVMDMQFKDIAEAKEIESKCKGSTAVCKTVEKEIKHKASPRLFDLTSLQGEANRMFGYTGKDTLSIVQELYEEKLCTYPRTDSQYLTEDMYDSVHDLIDVVSESIDFLGGVRCDYELDKCINNKKVSDHHAILPTKEIANCDFSALSEKKRNVLNLICARLVSATTKKYVYETTKIMVECEGYSFYSVGQVVIESGFRVVEDALKKLYGKEDKKEKDLLPPISEGDTFENVGSGVSEHETKPPQHYTDATLLKAMETAGQEEMSDDVERKGLGTSATRADVIENLIEKGYVVRNDKGYIICTERGCNLIKIVPDELKSPTMTAEWENQLALIAKGQASPDTFFADIISFVTEVVRKNKDKEITDNPFPVTKDLSSNDSLGECPNCGKDVKNGKYGIYCTNKCGMSVGKVFGKSLTEKQAKDLLAGKSVTLTFSKGKTTVLSEIESFSYNKDGKTISGYQWKVKTQGK